MKENMIIRKNNDYFITYKFGDSWRIANSKFIGNGLSLENPFEIISNGELTPALTKIVTKNIEKEIYICEICGCKFPFWKKEKIEGCWCPDCCEKSVEQ